jgi:hypothetical protein
VKEGMLIMAHVYKKTNEQFIKEVKDKFGDVYNLLEKYKRCSDKMQVQHKCEDGDWYTWSISPSNLLVGKGLCPKCSVKAGGAEEFKRKVFKMFGDEYIVTGEYINNDTEVRIQHNTSECQHEFTVRAAQFMNLGTRCPKCTSASRGESHIEDILKENLIPYDTQYIFKDCKFKQPLRFDFAVFKDLDKTDIKYMIEYQGEQHYSPQRFNGISQEKADKNYKENVIKDKIKVDYCKKNNIELLIIPYWERNKLEEILCRYNKDKVI